MPYVGHSSGVTVPQRVLVTRGGDARTPTTEGPRRRASQRSARLASFNDARAADFAATDRRERSRDELGSFFGSIGNAIKKGVTSVGHAVGTVVTSKIGQGLIGGALALTGVGLPASAAIFAASKGVGNLIKPGGNLSHALTGAAQGAVEGVVASEAGTLARAGVGKVLQRTATSTVNAAAGEVASPAAIDAIANQVLPGVQVTPTSSIAAPIVPAAPIAPAAIPYDPNAAAAAASAAAQIAAANQAASAAAAQLQAAQTQAQITAAQQAQAAALAQLQQLQTVQRASTASAATAPAVDPLAGGPPAGFDSADSGDSFAQQQAAQQASDAAATAAAQSAAATAAASSTTSHKMIIAAGVLAGVAGVAIVARKKRHTRRGGRR